VIFLTVGTQLPFDRLVSAVDEWAETASEDVFAQIGPSALRPRHIKYVQFVSAAECADRLEAASSIVAHAGMGTILMALQLGKPLLVMPRRADLGEHRNDHQLATARRFAELGVAVAFDEAELRPKLAALQPTARQPRIGPHAPKPLINGLRAFIAGEPLPRRYEGVSSGPA
jgi:UDP-N-acetylglucosamine transferase subunit ALG13